MSDRRHSANGAFSATQAELATVVEPQAVETFGYDTEAQQLVRSVRTRSGRVVESRLPSSRPDTRDLRRAYDLAWLVSKDVPNTRGARSIAIADVFSGCGLMTLGAAEACRALGLRPNPSVALDFNQSALQVYAANFPNATTLGVAIETCLDRDVGQSPSKVERAFVEKIGPIDLLVGGPPCQGHSDLNNHTRRRDTRNGLFIKMARFAELVRPKHIIVENVRGILHDRGGVYERTREALIRLGYKTDGELLNAADFGVPQQRRRFVMVASTERDPKLSSMVMPYRTTPTSFGWACADLKNRAGSTAFDSAPLPSERNKKRIDYLFDRDLHDLPNSQRPDCHRLKEHTYRSVYGRLRWDEPSQTVTTGFGSMGQGRYVHPTARRTITPHEAARLQFVPDFFRFGIEERTALAEMIGNGVPPKLIYVIALELLR